MRPLALATTLTVLIAAAACSSKSDVARSAEQSTVAPSQQSSSPASNAGPCGTAADPPAAYDHVIWIWMENHRFDQVIGNVDAPYENKLANACGLATRYQEVGSPSLPNYIGATSGDIQGIHDDASPSEHPLTVDNLFRQVRNAGKQARSYEEAMPQPCSLTPSGRYAVKHNPAAYYTGLDDRDACMRDNVALGTVDDGPLSADLRNDSLPAFAFITPDLCNDTHDCPVASGDAFLASWVDRIVGSTAYHAGRTAIFVAWDEDSPMPFIAVSPSTKERTSVDQRVDHYALLRTTEEMLGLNTFLGAAAGAPSMRPMFNL